MAMVDEQGVKRIVAAEMAGVRRLVSEKRIKRIVNEALGDVRDRLESVEADSELAIRAVDGLRNDLYGDPGKRSGPESLFERIDAMEQRTITRLDEQTAAIHGLAQRLDGAEMWINRRASMERAALRLAVLPVVALVRRWVPFVALFGGLVALFGMLVSLFGML